ncbi:MAG: DinB family protein [Candidatus Eiseniibacteriota bacterium]
MTVEEREKLIAQYEGGCQAVMDELRGFPEKELVAHPIPGKWSAREIVQHLADSEAQSGTRLRKLLAEEYPVMQPYDQDVWTVLLRYNVRDMAPALDLFRSTRASTAQLLRLMNDDDWKRVGWHPEHGAYPVTLWLQIYAAHAHNHAQQIRRLREALTR